MNTAPLKEIGLTESEIKVYIALLSLGQSTSGKIVDEAQVTRSKIYDLLEKLKQKGLVSEITIEGTKHFAAADPKNTLDLFDEKERIIQKQKKAMENLLPELLSQQKKDSSSQIAEVFIGFKGMKHAFAELVNDFTKNDTYYAYGAHEGLKENQYKIFFSNLQNVRSEAKVHTQIIFSESAKGKFTNQETSKLVKKRYLNQEQPVAINIYKDKAILLILNEQPITILIRSKETAESFKENFKVLWHIANN